MTFFINFAINFAIGFVFTYILIVIYPRIKNALFTKKLKRIMTKPPKVKDRPWNKNGYRK